MSVAKYLPSQIVISLMLGLSFGGMAHSAAFAIVQQHPLGIADVTTHELRSGDVVLGISEYGGGYINKLFIPKVGDILGRHAARFGRGGQVTIRDNLHRGRYNPTQAGFTDTAGTQCEIQQLSKSIFRVTPRPVALWNGDAQYDFTEWENLAADPYPGDRGNSDEDNINELNLVGKQATEITSEFDFTATFRDVMDGKRIFIPAFQFEYEFRFARMPGHAIRQFGSGTPAYDASAEIADRSNLAPPGLHPSTEDSLTGLILSSTLRGDKSVWNPSVIFLVGKEGRLVSSHLARPVRRAYQVPGKQGAYPLVIFSTNFDPDQGPAIGYFQPDSYVNRYGIVGRSVENDVMLYEDMRVTSGMIIGNGARTEGMWLFGAQTEYAGMLNRKETPAGVYEAIRGESYIFVGTPNEILGAAHAIQRGH